MQASVYLRDRGVGECPDLWALTWSRIEPLWPHLRAELEAQIRAEAGNR